MVYDLWFAFCGCKGTTKKWDTQEKKWKKTRGTPRKQQKPQEREIERETSGGSCSAVGSMGYVRIGRVPGGRRNNETGRGNERHERGESTGEGLNRLCPELKKGGKRKKKGQKKKRGQKEKKGAKEKKGVKVWVISARPFPCGVGSLRNYSRTFVLIHKLLAHKT